MEVTWAQGKPPAAVSSVVSAMLLVLIGETGKGAYDRRATKTVTYALLWK
jgi:hypothetical protein